jgi:hypothetical protein
MKNLSRRTSRTVEQNVGVGRDEKRINLILKKCKTNILIYKLTNFVVGKEVNYDQRTRMIWLSKNKSNSIPFKKKDVFS